LSEKAIEREVGRVKKLTAPLYRNKKKAYLDAKFEEFETNSKSKVLGTSTV
jgi:hypothetical protein